MAKCLLSTSHGSVENDRCWRGTSSSREPPTTEPGLLMDDDGWIKILWEKRSPHLYWVGEASYISSTHADGFRFAVASSNCHPFTQIWYMVYEVKCIYMYVVAIVNCIKKRSFIRLFIRSLLHSFVSSFIHSFIRSFIYSFIYLFICLFTYLLSLSFVIHPISIHSFFLSFFLCFIHHTGFLRLKISMILV